MPKSWSFRASMPIRTLVILVDSHQSAVGSLSRRSAVISCDRDGCR